MEANSGAPGRVTVVIERGAGRVFVAGQEVVLPPTEFRLLLALADTPGEATAVPELIEAVWGRDSHMSRPDLYWLVWSLRGRIGDEQRSKKVVANRKGHGYVIDLTTVDLEVVDVIGEAPAPAGSLDSETTPGAAVLGPEQDDHTTNDASAMATLAADAGVGGAFAGEAGTLRPGSQVLGGSAAAIEGAQATRRRPSLLLAGCVVAASLAVGFAARTLVDDTPPERSNARVAQADASPTPDASPETRRRPSEPERQPRGNSSAHKPRRPRSGGASSPVLAAPGGVSVPSSTGSSPPSGAAQPAPQKNTRAKPRPPQLPPPPTRYLYHLYNPENGDHLVTTDGGVVTEHEAKGYEGGAIGRVYVSQEKDTFAIPTNFGTAYVFAHASPKTDPASSVVALWLAQKGGDFFYTTSKAEATKDGWSASPSGYVRAL